MVKQGSAEGSLSQAVADRCANATPWVAVVAPYAFGTTVVMWAIGYLSHLDFVSAPKFALAILMVIPIAGGRAAARQVIPARRWQIGGATGLLSAILNLLILASILANPAEEERGASTLALQVGGFLLAQSFLGALGGFTVRGAPTLEPFSAEREGTRLFARIAAGATFLLVILGGIVTSHEAGLAVPDWPTSFEANMFLLPLSRMVSESGIYYEHAHRLFGALVGLTTLAVCLYLWRYESRRAIRLLGTVAFVMVCVQGVMGGLRVESAVDAAAAVESDKSLTLRVAHGVSGQIFFATMVGLTVLVSRGWRREGVVARTTARGERRTALVLSAAAIGQLFLGALVRHIDRTWLMPHILGAVVVGALVVWVAVRATTSEPTSLPVRSSGLALLFLVITQWFLGFFALAVTGSEARAASSGPLETLVATSHQATGALILAAIAVHTLRVFRHLELGSEASMAGGSAASDLGENRPGSSA